MHVFVLRCECIKKEGAWKAMCMCRNVSMFAHVCVCFKMKNDNVDGGGRGWGMKSMG